MVSGLPSCLGSGLGPWVPQLNLLLPVGAPGKEEAEFTLRPCQCPGAASAQHRTWVPSRNTSLSSHGFGDQKTPRCPRAKLPLEAPSRLFSSRQPPASLGLWPHPSDLCLCLFVAVFPPGNGVLNILFSGKDTCPWVEVAPNPGWSSLKILI